MKKNYITSLFMLLFGLLFTTANAQAPTVYLSSASGYYSVIEGNTFSFNVNLYSVNTTATVVTIATTAGSADSSDYTGVTTTVTIPAGQLSTTSALNIPTVNDSTIEPNEGLTITGTVTSGNTTNTTATLSLTIVDNDTAPTLYSSGNLTITESSNLAVYYYLSNPYSSNVVINLATTTGTAGSSDFTAVSSTLTIPAGQTSGYRNISITDDSLTEPDETFTLTGTVTSGNTTNISIVTPITIRDNDTPPTLLLNDDGYTAWEGGNFGFYAYLDRSYNSDVVVQFTTTNGTAGSADYTSTTVTKTITAGDTYVNTTIPITDDTLDEPNESFTVTGTVTSGNTTNTNATSSVTIVDNDGLPDLVLYSSDNNSPNGAGSGNVEEGQSAGFSIGLTHTSTSPTIVQITTTNGTAGSLDYTALTTTVTIPAGQTYYYSPLLLVPTILDQLQEASENFTVTATVTSGNTYNTSDSFLFTILDNYDLNAQYDTVTSVVQVGTTFPLLANDTLHGLPLNFSDVTITLGANTIGATMNAQGILTIPSNLAMGYYQLSYTICETANPGNCDTASITVQVVSPLEATFNLLYSDYNADGYTSVGDLITYQFNITNNGNAPLTNIDVDNAFNITVLGGPIAVLNPGQTDSTTFTAIHILTQDDINFGFFAGDNGQLELSFAGTYYGSTVTDWAQQLTPFSLNTDDGIRLKAFVDSNANGVQDGTEIDFPLGHFTYEVNNNSTVHNIYSTPFYLYESNPTTSYDLAYVVDSQYASNNTCAISYPDITVAAGSGITTYNFPITTTTYQDLSVNIHNYIQPPRPGFTYYSYISYTNNSNQTVASGTVTFTKDSAVTITYNSSGAANTATGFTLNFTNLLPYQTRYIWVSMIVPTIPTVSLGQLLTNSVSINLPAGDILPLNNTSSLTQTIVGAYDPNEKSESHGGKILHSGFTSNDYLTYTIQFENTGTANAINVKVNDVLDAKLDETTIKMVDASSPYVLERVGNTLTWNFFGIDLPPAVANSTVGHGYIVFQVKPKAGFALGDVIPNTASIYFDFNPAIVTNTCTTQFVSSLSTADFAFADFTYYPNPVKNNLSLSNASGIEEVEIISVLGQTLLTKKVNDLQTEISLTELPTGAYFVKVSSNGQEKTVKIMKE